MRGGGGGGRQSRGVQLSKVGAAIYKERRFCPKVRSSSDHRGGASVQVFFFLNVPLLIFLTLLFQPFTLCLHFSLLHRISSNIVLYFPVSRCSLFFGRATVRFIVKRAAGLKVEKARFFLISIFRVKRVSVWGVFGLLARPL